MVRINLRCLDRDPYGGNSRFVPMGHHDTQALRSLSGQPACRRYHVVLTGQQVCCDWFRHLRKMGIAVEIRFHDRDLRWRKSYRTEEAHAQANQAQ